MKSLSMTCVGLCLFTVITAGPPLATANDGDMPPLIEARKIWDHAPHNAFTDLIRFQDQWYCAFREGKGHVCDTGKLRVIRSEDGREWRSVGLIAREGGDVRDAKLSVTPQGKLMLSGAVRGVNPVEGKTHQSMVWLSTDGQTWGQGVPVADPNYWLWSVTWHDRRGYGIGYHCGPPRGVRLYQTANGAQWRMVADDLFPGGSYANESSLVFTDDGAGYCLLRRDGRGATGQLGVAWPPYTKWTWKDLGVKIGGPKMIRLPDGRFIAGVRLYDGKTRTSLCWVDVEKGRLDECLPLPSGGDCSYPGLVFHDGVLWVSYYSSHEGKTSIYLAKAAAEK